MAPITDSETTIDGSDWGQCVGWRLFSDRGYADITFLNKGTGVQGDRWIELYEDVLPEGMSPLNEDWTP